MAMGKRGYEGDDEVITYLTGAPKGTANPQPGSHSQDEAPRNVVEELKAKPPPQPVRFRRAWPRPPPVQDSYTTIIMGWWNSDVAEDYESLSLRRRGDRRHREG